MADETDAYGPPDALDSMTADQATARIDELKADQGFREQLLDSRHPGHDLAHQRMLNLHRVATGEALPEDHASNEAAARLERYKATIAADREHPVWNKRDPGHAAALEERDRLYAEAYPDDRAADQDAVTQTPPQEYAAELRGLRLPGDTIDDFRDGRDAVAGWLSDLKLLGHEAKAFVEAFNGAVARGSETDPDFAARQERALRAVWGDRYDAKIEAAARAVRRVDSDGTLTELLTITGLAQDANLVRALADAAERNGW